MSHRFQLLSNWIILFESVVYWFFTRLTQSGWLRVIIIIREYPQTCIRLKCQKINNFYLRRKTSIVFYKIYLHIKYIAIKIPNYTQFFDEKIYSGEYFLEWNRFIK